MSNSKSLKIGLTITAVLAIVSCLGFIDNLYTEKGASYLVSSGMAFLIFASMFAVGFKQLKRGNSNLGF